MYDFVSETVCTILWLHMSVCSTPTFVWVFLVGSLLIPIFNHANIVGDGMPWDNLSSMWTPTGWIYVGESLVRMLVRL